MAVCLVMEFDGIGEAEYESVLQKIDMVHGKIPAAAVGGVAHVAGPRDGGGWMVVDVWESQNHFDRFLQEHLAPAMATSGVPEPKVSAFPVHNVALS
jgi:hypothetical protein